MLDIIKGQIALVEFYFVAAVLAVIIVLPSVWPKRPSLARSVVLLGVIVVLVIFFLEFFARWAYKALGV